LPWHPTPPALIFPYLWIRGRIAVGPYEIISRGALADGDFVSEQIKNGVDGLLKMYELRGSMANRFGCVVHRRNVWGAHTRFRLHVVQVRSSHGVCAPHTRGSSRIRSSTAYDQTHAELRPDDSPGRWDATNNMAKMICNHCRTVYETDSTATHCSCGGELVAVPWPWWRRRRGHQRPR
jgi:hypothetical protein